MRAIFVGGAIAETPVKSAAKPKVTKAVKPVREKCVNLGKPIKAIALDAVLTNGHMSVVANGQFAEVLFQPFTRTRYEGDLIAADFVPDGERMVIWGKWDRNNPNVFKALAVSCRGHLGEVAVRASIAQACQNVINRRTLASTPQPNRRMNPASPVSDGRNAFSSRPVAVVEAVPGTRTVVVATSDASATVQTLPMQTTPKRNGVVPSDRVTLPPIPDAAPQPVEPQPQQP